MSSGGVFTLIANEGRTDRLLLATSLLNQRINNIQCARQQSGKQDCWPTLVDIERTHVLFMNAHYKPFVAIGFEYNKVRVPFTYGQSNNEVVFSIPQFGDFFYDMVCRVAFNKWSYGSKLAPQQSDKNPLEDPLWDATLDNNKNDVSWWNSKFPKNSADGKQQFRLVNYLGEVLVNGGNGDSDGTTPVNSGALAGLGVSGPEAAGSGTPGDRTRSYNNLARWVEYPANRLFKKVAFEVNNNPLDEYYDYVNVMYQKFCVPVNKQVGYNRMCGQEVPHDAWSGVKRYEVLTSDSNGLCGEGTNWLMAGTRFSTGMETVGAGTTTSKSVNGVRSENHPTMVSTNIKRADLNGGESNGDVFHFEDPLLARYLEKVVDGPQTPKEVQPCLELMHKLHFWFNNDVRLAVPSVSIPYGQRFIKITFADPADMISSSPGLYVEKIHTDLDFVPGIDKNTLNVVNTPADPSTWIAEIDALAANNGFNSNALGFRVVADPTTGSSLGAAPSKMVSEYYPYVEGSNSTNITMDSVELYINNIFVNPEIHDIFIRRIGFTLIRVHRCGRYNTDNDSLKGEKQLTALKWPIEFMFIGMRPNWNTCRENRWMWRDWHRLSKVDTGFFPDEGTKVDLFANAAGVPNGTTQQVASLQNRVVQKTEFCHESQTLSELSVSAHGIHLYDTFGSMFYNAYLPYQFGNYNINTPEDAGAMLITFCLYPKTYQPSGHINVSRAREFFINWTGKYDGRTELLVVASAINFLLISDGSAVLRYST